MPSPQAAPIWVAILPYIVVVAIVVWRLARPQKISVARMWVSPIILIAIAGFAIFATDRQLPAAPWEIALAIVVGLLLGIPVGMFRGMHTVVKPTDRPGVMYLGTSWITAAIWIGAFVLRGAIRYAMPHSGSLSTVIGDGLLAFAIAIVAATYAVILRKYEREAAQTSTSASA